MELIFDLELITNFMKENNLTKTQFCKLCGFSIPTLKKVFRNDLSLRLPVVFKLSRAMGIEPKELFYKQNK